MLLSVLACLATGSPRKVATITVNELYRSSDLVVIAEVKGIRNLSGIKIATADVQQIFKGRPAIKSVDLVAEEVWNCDISTAIKGERVLLYLRTTNIESPFDGQTRQIANLGSQYRAKGSRLYDICHSGRGRFQLAKGKTDYTVQVLFVENRFGDDAWKVNPDVRLPNGKLVRNMVKDSGHIKVTDMLTYR